MLLGFCQIDKGSLRTTQWSWIQSSITAEFSTKPIPFSASALVFEFIFLANFFIYFIINNNNNKLFYLNHFISNKNLLKFVFVRFFLCVFFVRYMKNHFLELLVKFCVSFSYAIPIHRTRTKFECRPLKSATFFDQSLTTQKIFSFFFFLFLFFYSKGSWKISRNFSSNFFLLAFAFYKINNNSVCK